MKKPLIDWTDAEVLQRLRASVEHVQWSPNDMVRELDRRSQDRHSRALRFQGWAIIALTVFVALAAVAQAAVSVATMTR